MMENRQHTKSLNRPSQLWAELARAMALDADLATWVLSTPHDGLHLSRIGIQTAGDIAPEVISESLLEHLGYAPPHGTPADIQALPSVEPRALRSIQQLSQDNDDATCSQTEVRYRHRNGNEIPYQAQQRVIRDADGQVRSILTKLIHSQPASDEKEHPQPMLAEGQALKAAIEQNQQRLLNFTSMASHDLQAPLRHINGMVQLLLIHNDDVLDEKSQQLIHRTIQSVETLQQLIDDLLIYSQVESRSVNLEPLAMHRVCGEAIELLSASIEESGATIHCEFLPTVHADRSMMMHLIQNLISNGIKYCGDTKPSIVIRSEENTNHWTLFVEDQGIGIDPKQHEQIFESFKRLHSASSSSGAGLGLSICKTIVERHGGTMAVESEPNQGSRFYFTLPKQPPEL